LLSITQQC